MIRRVFGNLYFLTFLNGFLLASLFYFKMEANYENELFQAIHSDISSKIKTADSQDSVAVKVMHACHSLMVSRESVFEGKQFQGLKSDLLEPTSIDLMTARGACGSFALVLARVLQGYEFQVRIAQMKSNGVFAAHNIVEAKTGHGWVVLDPFFNVYFEKPSHQLASFEDVKENWNYYKAQLPPGYDMNFSYEDVRYSNWTKIPVILPAIKKVLDLTLGKEKADGISLRAYFLSKYNICFNIVLTLFILVFTFTFLMLIKAKVFPQKNIPITFSNIYKYFRLRFIHKSLPERGQA
ncbi:MAG TPA: hypothetical protein VGZ90_18830 [Puia sp.]|jgi:hypothetical protein|nr:hypothetical protein [Puia sp.]